MKQYNVGFPFERIAIDVAGPFPLSKSGNQYIDTLVSGQLSIQYLIKKLQQFLKCYFRIGFVTSVVPWKSILTKAETSNPQYFKTCVNY